MHFIEEKFIEGTLLLLGHQLGDCQHAASGCRPLDGVDVREEAAQDAALR